MDIYRQGWDVLREKRFARMKKIGLINNDSWSFTERSIVPVDRDDIANHYSGKQNPAWDTLESDRQEDLARRMSIFAASVEHVDRGVGMMSMRCAFSRIHLRVPILSGQCTMKGE